MARHVLQESPPFKAQRSACERAMDDVGCASSALRCDLFVERRCDRLVELGEEVAVTVERHVDRAVAHTRLDCLRVCSCRETGTHRYSNRVECPCSGSQVLHLAGALSTGQHWALSSVTSAA